MHDKQTGHTGRPPREGPSENCIEKDKFKHFSSPACSSAPETQSTDFYFPVQVRWGPSGQNIHWPSNLGLPKRSPEAASPQKASQLPAPWPFSPGTDPNTPTAHTSAEPAVSHKSCWYYTGSRSHPWDRKERHGQVTNNAAVSQPLGRKQSRTITWFFFNLLRMFVLD